MADTAGYIQTTTPGAVVLKAAHPDPFSSGSMKMKIFIQQMDNKIADAALATDQRKIRYATSLFRGPAAEWTMTKTNDKGVYMFLSYAGFRREFLERFSEPNPVGTAMKKMLNLR